MQTFNDIATLILNLLPSDQQISAANHRTVETAILTFAKEQWLPGDLKMIDCTNEYISANFETSGPTQGRGLPGGERDGWAICNGYNGTMNRTGRVPLAWGNVASVDAYGLNIAKPDMKNGNSPVTSGTIAEALTVNQMPTHNHDFMIRADSSGISGNFLTLADTANSDEGGFNTYLGGDTTTSNVTIKNRGGGAGHNNMQPYIVTLFIQKL